MVFERQMCNALWNHSGTIRTLPCHEFVSTFLEFVAFNSSNCFIAVVCNITNITFHNFTFQNHSWSCYHQYPFTLVVEASPSARSAYRLVPHPHAVAIQCFFGNARLRISHRWWQNSKPTLYFGKVLPGVMLPRQTYHPAMIWCFFVCALALILLRCALQDSAATE